MLFMVQIMYFHAAALKDVPSCEFFPMEAVKTNIIGTDNVITAAVENTSHNTNILDVDGVVEKIMTTNYVREELEGRPHIVEA